MERRQHKRVACKNMTCHLGEVVDISVGGMQILGKGKQKLEAEDELSGELRHEGEVVELKMRVVWTKKMGVGRWAYGLEFIGVNEDDERELEMLVECGHDEFVGPQFWLAA